MACPNATTGIPTAFAITNFLNLSPIFFPLERLNWRNPHQNSLKKTGIGEHKI